MRGIFSIILVLLFSALSFAANEAISITVKPSTGLSGITSFNIHQSGEFTVLNYESPTKITERTIVIDPKTIREIDVLAHEVLREIMIEKNYSIFL